MRYDAIDDVQHGTKRYLFIFVIYDMIYDMIYDGSDIHSILPPQVESSQDECICHGYAIVQLQPSIYNDQEEKQYT